MPYMDWRLVCLAFALPDASKVGGGYSKRVLRQAMAGVLPEPIRLRTDKVGFNSPLPDWFSGPLRGWLLDLVNEPDFLQGDLWDGHGARDVVTTGLAAGRLGWPEVTALWPILHAHLWRKHFLGARAPRPVAAGRAVPEGVN
jgi:asparagine synthase (glutamine-hydrolysing)